MTPREKAVAELDHEFGENGVHRVVLAVIERADLRVVGTCATCKHAVSPGDRVCGDYLCQAWNLCGCDESDGCTRWEER